MQVHSARPERKPGLDLNEAVGSVVQSVLGSLPSLSQPLMEAGLDSLGAVELRNALSARLSLPDLPATLTYDYTTIQALAAHLAGKFKTPLQLSMLFHLESPIF